MLQEQLQGVKGLKRFVTAQNVSLLLSLVVYYLLSRSIDWSAPWVFLRQLYDYGHLLYWEKRMGWLILALTAEKLWRRSTVDGFLADISFYLRTIPCFVLLSADYRLGLYLVLWNLVSFLLLPPGRYRGANEITPLTPTSLDSLAMNEAGKETWLVMLSAPWSAKSLQAQHTFSELSNEYSSESLKFGELEVSRWPKIAVKFDVNIESIPHQLPTFLLFKHGQLVKRLPEKDDMWQKKTRLRTQIVNHFELDMHMAKGM